MLIDKYKELMKYSLDPALFTKEVLGWEVKWFHREWLDIFEKYDKVILLAPRAHGKCFTEDRKIVMADGDLKKIIDCKVGDEIIAFDENDFKLKKARISAIYNNGVRDVYLIKTASGRETVVTKNHPFFTASGWKSISDGLKEGDFIAIPNEINIDNSDKLLDEEVKLLAVLIAEGALTDKSKISFSSSNLSLVAEIAQIATAFGVTIKPRTENDSKFDWDFIILEEKERNKLKLWLKELNLLGKYSYEKFVPNIIFQTSNRQIALFLKYLWLCDGNISLNNRDMVEISYSTSSKQLAFDIQYLLDRLGIKSSIYYHKTNRRDNYQVVINGAYYQLKFLDNILDRKNYEVRSKIREPFVSTEDVIPRDLILNAIELTPWYIRKLFGIRLDNNYNITKKKARKLLSIFNSKELQKIVFNDINWDKIKEIKYLGRKKTYGLEISPYHTHIVDGIISHNSTIIIAYIIWKILVNPDIRILLLTVKHDKAQEFIEKVKYHLEYNPKIVELWGNQKSTSNWTKKSITVASRKTTSASKEPNLTVSSITSEDIGGHYDLIILDDIVHEKNVATELQRRKLKRKFDEVITYMLEPQGKLLLVGTRWHKDDLYATLSKYPHYKVFTYKAIIYEPTEEERKAGKKPIVLWEERYPYEKLVQMREEKGKIVFAMQSQNEIVYSDESIFNIEKLNTFTTPPPNLRIYQGVDLASLRGKDYFTIVTIGINDIGDIYILHYIRKHLSIAEQLRSVMEMYDIWKPIAIGVENQAYQSAFITELNLIDPSLPIVPISPTGSKVDRAQRLATLVDAGRVYIKEDMGELYDELAYFPYGEHDDLVDALVYALNAIRPRKEIDWSTVANMIYTVPESNSLGLELI